MARKLVSHLSLFEGRKVNVYRKVDVDAVLSEKDARIRKLLEDVQKQNLELQHCYKRIHRLSVEKYFFEQNERNYLECIDADAVEIAELKAQLNAQLESEPARSPVDFEVLTEEQMESRRFRERAEWLYRASHATLAKQADKYIKMANKPKEK